MRLVMPISNSCELEPEQIFNPFSRIKTTLCGLIVCIMQRPCIALGSAFMHKNSLVSDCTKSLLLGSLFIVRKRGQVCFHLTHFAVDLSLDLLL